VLVYLGVLQERGTAQARPAGGVVRVGPWERDSCKLAWAPVRASLGEVTQICEGAVNITDLETIDV